MECENIKIMKTWNFRIFLQMPKKGKGDNFKWFNEAWIWTWLWETLEESLAVFVRKCKIANAIHENDENIKYAK